MRVIGHRMSTKAKALEAMEHRNEGHPMTTTQPVDAIVARIREALEAGPTDGPWTTAPGDGEFDAKSRFETDDKVLIYAAEDCDSHPIADCSCNFTCRAGYEQEQNATYIAACSPDAIRTLLAHMDGLKKDGERLEWLEATIQKRAAVWLLPCGETKRFVQIRHVGDGKRDAPIDNHELGLGLRAAIDAAIKDKS